MPLKKYRLIGKKDFEKVFKTGQGRHGKILGIWKYLLKE
jgi:RNase P protein component